MLQVNVAPVRLMFRFNGLHNTVIKDTIALYYGGKSHGRVIGTGRKSRGAGCSDQ